MKILSHIKKKSLNDWESSKFIKCQKTPVSDYIPD